MTELPDPNVTDEQAIFAWLQRKYVQHADDRQEAMGLVYMTAETHDLARELARMLAERARARALELTRMLAARAGTGAQYIPANFSTHRNAWRDAITECINTERARGNRDQALYWEHELAAFDRAFTRLLDHPEPIKDPQP